MSQTAKTWIRRIALGLVVLLLVAGAVMAFQPKPVLVDLAVAERGPLEVTIDEDGRTRVVDHYVVSAPVSGNLARIELRAGDKVETGDILARIEAIEAPLMDSHSRDEVVARLRAAEAARRQAAATISRAKVAKDFAERELERQRKLLKNNSISRRAVDVAEVDLESRTKEVESAKFGAKVAKYEVEMAKAALRRIDRAKAKAEGKDKKTKKANKSADGEDGEVTKDDLEEHEMMEVGSPVDGTVLRVHSESEGVVGPGAPLLELADPTNLELVVDVLTSDAIEIKPGAHVYVERWGGDEVLNGRVRLVEPSAFTKISALGVEEQRVNVVIDLTDEVDKWSALGDGYRVEVRIVVWEGEDVLKVPVSALFRHEEGWALYVEDGGVARLRAVKVGKRQGLLAEVVEGLEEGDKVVAHPSDDVVDGVDLMDRAAAG